MDAEQSIPEITSPADRDDFLLCRPHEFVPLVMSEIQGAFGRLKSRGRSAQRKGGSGATQQSILEDIIYCWMLAEAYVQHPALQADMR